MTTGGDASDAAMLAIDGRDHELDSQKELAKTKSALGLAAVRKGFAGANSLSKFKKPIFFCKLPKKQQT